MKKSFYQSSKRNFDFIYPITNHSFKIDISLKNKNVIAKYGLALLFQGLECLNLPTPTPTIQNKTVKLIFTSLAQKASSLSCQQNLRISWSITILPFQLQTWLSKDLSLWIFTSSHLFSAILKRLASLISFSTTCP